MPTTTPNFGWSVPVSTDLVKDGATAIELLGDSIDTSLVDLKGGTTGQVLAKASGTDMDFSWVAVDPLLILDAKGDLISATAADTPARLAVGANGTVLTADSTESTGLKWVAPSSPGFVGVSLTGTTTQAIPDSTATAITFPTELIDTDGFHSTVSNTSRITIPAGKGGKYLFNSIFYFAANATGFRFSTFRKNGTVASGFAVLPGSSATVVGLVNSIVLDLVATDYVEMFVQQSSGGNLNNDTANSFFSAIYLGA
jgi:hypothetical protein